MSPLIERMRRLSAAEEFFALLAVPYDPKVLQVARLHVLRRMSQYLADTALDALTDDAAEEACRARAGAGLCGFRRLHADRGAHLQGAPGRGRRRAPRLHPVLLHRHAVGRKLTADVRFATPPVGRPDAQAAEFRRLRAGTKLALSGSAEKEAGMHIVVCIKQVPDSAQIRVHPVTNTIMRQGVPTIINPYDLFALEEALRLRDKFGGEVTVLTMGPPMAEDSLRKALGIGANRGVLLTDRFFAGSDTLATSFALAQAVRKIGETWGAPEIVFTGKQTIDGDTAQVGPGIARRLGLNQLTYVAAINALDLAGGSIAVSRRAEGGVQELSTKLPALITMLEGTNEIRRGTVPDVLRAARAKIEVWNAATAGITEMELCGLRGSPTVVKRVFAPTPRAAKAEQVEAKDRPFEAIAEDVMERIFAAQPAMEAELMRTAAGY